MYHKLVFFLLLELLLFTVNPQTSSIEKQYIDLVLAALLNIKSAIAVHSLSPPIYCTFCLCNRL